MREGLRLLEERDRKVAELRKEIQDAIDEGGSYTEEEVRVYIAELSASEPPKA